jgi:hypothetical protein
MDLWIHRKREKDEANEREESKGKKRGRKLRRGGSRN